MLEDPLCQCLLDTCSDQVVGLKASGSSRKVLVFIASPRMNFAFFPLAGPPESWGTWLTLQEMSQLILCLVFQQSWSSRKWS